MYYVQQDAFIFLYFFNIFTTIYKKRGNDYDFNILERERKMIIIFSKRLELWLTRPKRALEENFLSGAKDVATYE